jgi:DNA polymerase III delta prime subunit
MEEILLHYNQHGRAVALLHGPTGTGKSIMGLLLAKNLSANFCNTLKPWQPGDMLGEFYADIEPTTDKPLILVFDEFDNAIISIHEGIPPNPKIPISVPDKTGWNRMLDEIHWGLYPHMILLLISNRSPDFISNLDPSYIRKGRVDMTFHMSLSTILE